jgi:hypothetical protein
VRDSTQYLDSVTQNGPNTGFVKHQFFVQTLLRLTIETRVKNLEGSQLFLSTWPYGKQMSVSCRESPPSTQPQESMESMLDKNYLKT